MSNFTFLHNVFLRLFFFNVYIWRKRLTEVNILPSWNLNYCRRQIWKWIKIVVRKKLTIFTRFLPFQYCSRSHIPTGRKNMELFSKRVLPISWIPQSFNTLLHNKILHFLKSKHFQMTILNKNKMSFLYDRFKIIVGKGRNVGNQHHLLFLKFSQNVSSQGPFNFKIVRERV